MNSDGYNFIAECPICKEKRGVCCSRSQAKTEEQIAVYAIVCDHSWKLTREQSATLREQSFALVS